MIHVDVTKTGRAAHRSGLTRVTRRILQELAPGAKSIEWPFAAAALGPADWILTAELFSEDERPGMTTFLEERRCRAAAIFHDAIPLKHPHITWPQSVARHPVYMKLLARFDRVWAVSAASRDELIGFWRWQGIERMPPVDVLPLGADFNGAPRRTEPIRSPGQTGAPILFCLGIIEPRKNQSFLLDTCVELWQSELSFELHFAGRVNPHFGSEIAGRIKANARTERRLRFHEAPGDGRVAQLFAAAHATVLPTIAEGCGLPLLESLWMGVPCVCSDLPVLRENTAGGGCLPVPITDGAAWRSSLQRVLTDDVYHAELVRQAMSRPLPTWRDAARMLANELR